MCDYSQYIEESRSQWKNKDSANFNQINKKKIKKKLFMDITSLLTELPLAGTICRKMWLTLWV